MLDMKALTLTQPWATAVALGLKRIETRNWRTGYRGSLAVHAAKAMDFEARFFCLADMLPDRVQGRHVPNPLHNFGLRSFRDYPRGVVVAFCRLVNCVPTESEAMSLTLEQWGGPAEGVFGNFGPGRWAWLLADVVACEPIPARGARGLWEWRP